MEACGKQLVNGCRQPLFLEPLGILNCQASSHSAFMNSLTFRLSSFLLLWCCVLLLDKVHVF